jgi:hypothetical protein
MRRSIMKERTLAAIFALFILVAFTQPSIAEMPKEGSGSSTTIYSGTFTAVPADEGHYVVHYTNKGVMVSDEKNSPFNNMSVYNVGTMYFENGIGRLTGYMTCTDPEGDKVVIEIKETNSKPAPAPGGNSGTGKFLFGTGKFSGIEGTTEYTRWYVYPATKDTYQAIGKSTATWKIP